MKSTRRIAFILGASILALLLFAVAGAVLHSTWFQAMAASESAAPGHAALALSMVGMVLPFAGRKMFEADKDKSAAAFEEDSAAIMGEPDVKGFLDSISALRDQVNAMLKGLPPLEQFEASQELGYGLRSLTSYANNLVELSQRVSGQMTAIAQKAAKLAGAKAEARLLGGGDYIKKTDSELAVSQAVENKTKEINLAATAQRELETKISGRRAELLGKKELSAEAVNAISAEIMGADDYLAQYEKIKPRAALILAAGIDPDKGAAFTAEIFGLPLTAEGESQVTARLETVKGLLAAATKTVASTASRQTPPKETLAPIPAGGSGAAKPKRFF